jgi:hypothetical protein
MCLNDGMHAAPVLNQIEHSDLEFWTGYIIKEPFASEQGRHHVRGRNPRGGLALKPCIPSFLPERANWSSFLLQMDHCAIALFTFNSGTLLTCSNRPEKLCN